MGYIILVKHPNGRIIFIGDDEQVEVFPNIDVAIEVADNQILCQSYPYQIVELDEL